jgi:hypothetical protein
LTSGYGFFVSSSQLELGASGHWIFFLLFRFAFLSFCGWSNSNIIPELVKQDSGEIDKIISSNAENVRNDNSKKKFKPPIGMSNRSSL